MNMLITRIEKAGRKVQIFLNDAPGFCLYPSELAEYHLQAGQELSEELQTEIYSAVLLKRAKLRCLNLLKTKDRTVWQLRTRLCQDGYPPQVAEEAIAYAASFHYVDDAAYARRYLQEKRTVKSLRQIRMDLKARGIDGETLDEAFSELSEQGEAPDNMEALRYWVKKRRFDPASADEKERAKMMRFLLGKGFSYNEIMEINRLT